MTTPWLKSIWQDDQRLRRRLLIVDIGLIGFWVYAIAYILNHPADKGSDGFEVILAIPVTQIAVFLSLPALVLLIWNRTLRIGAWITLAAIVANVVLWTYILLNGGLGHFTFWPLW